MGYKNGRLYGWVGTLGIQVSLKIMGPANWQRGGEILTAGVNKKRNPQIPTETSR